MSAVDLLRRRSSRGDARATLRLAERFENGDGVHQDDCEALRLYRAAADTGLADAQFALGLAHAGQRLGLTEDYAEAVRWFWRAAEQGDPRAQREIGLCFKTGKAAPHDPAEAVRRFRVAADGGDARAFFHLGECCADGLGVARDQAEAIRCFRMGSERGDPAAQCALGFCYSHGTGVPCDLVEAARLYRRGAEAGYAAAEYNLAMCYEHGHGVRQDPMKAMRWFRLAALQGDTDAQALYDRGLQRGSKSHQLLTPPQEQMEAVVSLSTAAGNGDARAECIIGEYYETVGANYDLYLNAGVSDELMGSPEEAMAEAVRLYRHSAAQGNAEAHFKLGNCAERGRGMPEDLPEAVRQYSAAVDGGSALAHYHLGRLTLAGHAGLPPDVQKGAWLLRRARALGCTHNALDALAPLAGERDVASQVCAACATADPRRLRACERCHVARFCSKECLSRSWAAHKPHCMAWRREAPESPTRRSPASSVSGSVSGHSG